MKLTILATLLLTFSSQGGLVLGQKNPNFVGNRSTIVHLFEWTWPDIAKECEEFLGPRGYGGVQISPANEVRVTEKRAWWERYQPISYRLHSRSGNEAQLRNMIRRCNRVGVRIYADVVFNHMSASQPGETVGTAGSVGNYDQKFYPAVPYGPADFNPQCDISNYQDAKQVRNCQLNTLLDLNQGRSHVRQMIVNYLNYLLAMGVAGFRIDAAKHMWPADLQAIYAQLSDLNEDLGVPKGTRPYIYQEVIDLGFEAVTRAEYTPLGIVTEFKFSLEIGRVFRGINELKYLQSWGLQWGLSPGNDAIVFVDSHDNQRGYVAGGSDILTYKNGAIYSVAMIFMLAHPYGNVARVMSSYSFIDTDQGPPTTDGYTIRSPSYQKNGRCDTDASGWVCEHRWPEIANMVQFRNVAGNSSLTNWWDNNINQIAFARNKKGFVAINMEVDHTVWVTLDTSLPAGTYCDVITGNRAVNGSSCTGNKIEVDSAGKADINLLTGPSALAIHLGSRLEKK